MMILFNAEEVKGIGKEFAAVAIGGGKEGVVA